MTDNPFNTPTSGQGDWDSGLGLNFQALDRGYHATERAGTAINTGQVLWLNSGGFFFPFNPNSADIFPQALTYTAAASGDTLTALVWGIVRSLGINSPAIAGEALYVSPTTPGVIVGSYAGADRQIGWGLTGNGVLFSPAKTKPAGGGALGTLSDVNTGGLADGDVLRWSDVTSKWEPVVPGTGVTQLGSLSDVTRTGLSDGKVPMWSDATSKFTMQAPGGGGGVSPGAVPAVVQAITLNNSVFFTFAATPTPGNIVLFVLGSGETYLQPCSVNVNLEGFFKSVGATYNAMYVFSRVVQAGDGKEFEFHNTDGDTPWAFAFEFSGAKALHVKGAYIRPSSTQVIGAPQASTGRGNALGLAFATSDKDCRSSSLLSADWTLQGGALGGAFGGSGIYAQTNSPIGVNSPTGCLFSINSYTNASLPVCTVVVDPSLS